MVRFFRAILLIAPLWIASALLASCAGALASPSTAVEAPTAVPATLPFATGAATPTRTASPKELATWQAGESRYQTAVALGATEQSLLPDCRGWWDHSESPDGEWKTLECISDGMGVYNQMDHSKAWYLSYYDLYGLPYENGNHFGHVYPIHWSADGKYLYLVPRWSGDGGCVMYDDGSALYRLDLASGARVLLIPPTADRLYGSFSFSNADTYVAHIALSPAQPAVLTLLDLRDGTTTDISLGKRYAEGGYLIWSPDNQEVLFSARSRGECETMTYYIVLMDLRQRAQKIIKEGTEAQFVPVEWASENQVVVQAIESGYLFNMQLPSGEMKPYSGPAILPTP